MKRKFRVSAGMRRNLFGFYAFIATSLLMLAPRDEFALAATEEFEKRRILIEKAELKSAPSFDSVTVGHPSPGTPLRVKRTDHAETVRGFEANWFQVSQEPQAFIWEPALAAIELPLADGAMFLAGVTDRTTSVPPEFILSTLVLKQGQTVHASKLPLTTTDFHMASRFLYEIEGKVSDGRGLSGVKNVFEVYTHYDACGYVSTRYYFFWTGTTVVGPLEAPHVGEAGQFNSSTRLVFPAGKEGKPNMVIVVKDVEHFEEKTKSYRLTERSEDIYAWSGKGLQKVPGESGR
jgi:hypothetical protein